MPPCFVRKGKAATAFALRKKSSTRYAHRTDSQRKDSHQGLLTQQEDCLQRRVPRCEPSERVLREQPYESVRPLVSGITAHNDAAMRKATAVTEKAAPKPRCCAIVPTTNGATALARRPML